MNFREWFDQMGCSKMAIARMLDVDRLTVERWLNGVKPRKAIMHKIMMQSRWLKIPITREMFE